MLQGSNQEAAAQIEAKNGGLEESDRNGSGEKWLDSGNGWNLELKVIF